MSTQPGHKYIDDPNRKKMRQMDWDDWLNTSAQIVTSTWTVTGPDALCTVDNTSIAVDGRSTYGRVIGGTAGATYKVTNHIITNETPAQEDERSYYSVIRDI